ncbi:MAG TPA: putative glycoside hydrolase [Gemmatimonadaceae bacterium]|nr:putative glycoside hydrolase [Gemmatimonadaceae bacterium]
MRRPYLFLVALATFVQACTSVSEHADQPAASPAPPGSVVATASGAVATDTAPRLPIAAARPTARPARRPASAAPEQAVTDSSKPRAAAVPPEILAMRDPRRTPVIRALYVNRFAAQSARRMRWLVGVADSTEINGLVIDMKDEFGLNYRSAHPEFRRNAGSGHGMVRDVPALLDTLHAHGIFAIARIVVFKDPVAAQVNPQWTIRRPDGSNWQDKKGFTWVDPYNRALWDYNLGVAAELTKLGFDEIQFDYIRFPEPYKSLPPQVFPASKGTTKPELLAEFLTAARERMHSLGVRTTADVFGLVTSVGGPLEVGQWWEKLAPVTDVMLPMVYPSHYPHGSYGLARPNADPYAVVHHALTDARRRDEKLGVAAPEHVRAWLQAFSIGKPEYGAEQLTAQKQAVYDAGYDGWVLWHPGSKYEPFVPALERGALVSHKK